MTTEVAIRTRLVARLGDYAEAISWAPDGRHLVVGSLAGDVRTVEPATGAGRDLPPHPLGTTAVAWSPDGALIVTGGQDGRVRLWDVERQRTLAEHEGQGWVTAAAWRPDGAECAATIGRAMVRFDRSGVELHRTPDHPATATSLAWTPDGRRVAVGSYGGLWWYEAASVHRKHFEWKGAVLTVAVAPNGRHVASGNQDNSVHCWKLWIGDDFQMTGYEQKIQHLAWSPDSRFLAVAGLGDITIWDFSGRGPQGSRPRQLTGHTKHLVAVGYRPAGEPRLMSAAADGRVCLWLAKAAKRSLVADVQLGDPVGAARWSPDGTSIAAVTADGGVFVVDAD